MFGFASKLEVKQLKAQVERLAQIVEALQSELKGNKQNDTSLQESNSKNMKAAKERAKRRAIAGNKVTNQPLIFQRQREGTVKLPG
jgi:regulator of protease activity HflC (stomatin/prohibitin superfamily)